MFAIMADEEMNLEGLELIGGETMISVHNTKTDDSMSIILTTDQLKRLIKELIEMGFRFSGDVGRTSAAVVPLS